MSAENQATGTITVRKLSGGFSEPSTLADVEVVQAIYAGLIAKSVRNSNATYTVTASGICARHCVGDLLEEKRYTNIHRCSRCTKGSTGTQPT